MGDELMPSTENNKQGHWEDMSFYRLHVEILQANGLHPNGLYGDLSNCTVPDQYQKQMRSLLETKNLRETPWGWKDPRTCLFIDQYHRLVKNAFYLIVYRNPEEVIDSLLRRDINDYLKEFKKQGTKGKIKELFKKWYLKKFIERSTANYIEKYIYYNQLILNFVERLPKKDFFLFDISNIFNIQEPLFDKLQKSGFIFHPIDSYTVFDDKLMKHSLKTVNTDFLKNNRELQQIHERFNSIKN